MLHRDRIRFYRQNSDLRVDDLVPPPRVTDAASIFGDQAAIAGGTFGPSRRPPLRPRRRYLT